MEANKAHDTRSWIKIFVLTIWTCFSLGKQLNKLPYRHMFMRTSALFAARCVPNSGDPLISLYISLLLKKLWIFSSHGANWFICSWEIAPLLKMKGVLFKPFFFFNPFERMDMLYTTLVYKHSRKPEEGSILPTDWYSTRKLNRPDDDNYYKTEFI